MGVSEKKKTEGGGGGGGRDGSLMNGKKGKDRLTPPPSPTGYIWWMKGPS